MKIIHEYFRILCLSIIVAGFAPIAGNAQEEIIKEVIQIEMPDGVKLVADLFKPAGDSPLPCIVVRTPYGRYQHEQEGRFWASHGYTALIQDTRGKWDSEGEFYPFVNEKEDGIATLNWVQEQVWCDGRIGMWGSSYLSYCVFVLAAENHPALKSGFVVSGWLTGDEIINPGGSMHLMLSLAWILHEETQKKRNLGNYEMDDMFNHLPLIEAFSSVGIESKVWTDRFLDWEASTRNVTPESINIPMYHVTGWWDFVQDASLNIYKKLSSTSDQLQKLTVGPWFHDQLQTDYTEAGDANYGPQSIMGRDKLNELSLQWFDHTLKGLDNGMDQGPLVEYFQMGENVWKESSTWPPKINPLPFYLSSKQGANSSSGDGVINQNPIQTEGIDHFLFDPNNPIPTHGGDNFHFFLHTLGLKDQSDIEERKDVLVYTSEILEEDLSITGEVKVKLFVATEGKDTDFTAKLVDVHENGYAGILMDGIQRLSFRESKVKPIPVEPGKVYEISIQLGHIAYTFPAGHRIRLDISSSNFPKYDRNPNTGEEAWHAKKLMPVSQKVLFGSQYPSALVLPVTAANTTTEDPELQAGIDLFNQNKWDDAIKAFSALEQQDRNSVDYNLWAGKAYLEKVQVASHFERGIIAGKVISHLKKVIKLDPTNIEARQHLSSYYMNAPSIAGGSIKKAEQLTREILELSPDDPMAYYNMGMFYQKHSKFDEAISSFQKAYALDAQFYGALYQVGRTTVLAKNRLDLGVESFMKYLEADIQDPIPSKDAAWWRLGMTYQLQGKIENAKAAYQKALEVLPGEKKYLEALESL